MKALMRLIREIFSFMVRFRWIIVFIFSVGLIILEISEHLLSKNNQDFAFFFETGVFGLVFPVLLGTLLTLYQTQANLSLERSKIGQKRFIEAQISGARDWDELTTTLLQIPRTMFQLCASQILTFEPETQTYRMSGQWLLDDSRSPLPNILEQISTGNFSFPSNPGGEFTSGVHRVIFLPIQKNDAPLALILLYQNKNEDLNSEQLSLWKETAPIISLAIENQMLHASNRSRISMIEGERTRMARYLHDTLVPDLAYLRLKLDQFSFAPIYREDSSVQKEIARMCKIANQSYDYTRNILTVLREESSFNFMQAIRESANMFAERAGFEVKFREQGIPFPTSPAIGSQILLIIREALRNIEKYAEASQVVVTFHWDSAQLLLNVEDNGHGFNADTIDQAEQHFGLNIIQEIVNELNGKFTISSTLGEGTCLQICISLG